MFKIIIKFFIITILFVSCDKDENEKSSPYPLVETLGSQVFSSGGVQLQGNISNLGDSEIIAYGFELLTKVNTNYYSSNHIVDLPASQDQFSLNILSGLYPDLEYEYTAYVTTALATYRGETLSFVSSGSASPKLLACSPSIAHIGDTVVLKGENFPTNSENITLKFGNSYAEILTITTTELSFVVPKPEGNLRSLEISTYGNQAFEYGLLDLYQPIITNINPTTAFFGDTITILGDHFNTNIYNTSVTIGGYNATLISGSRNEIQVIIPEDVNYDNSIITVYAQNQEVSYNNFTIKVPEFTYVPNQIYTDEYFTVTVDQTYENKNLFLIDGVEYYPIIINDTTLHFYMYSSQTFNQREIEIKWVINDLEIVSEQLLNISNPFFNIKDVYNNFPFGQYDVFTINNKAVVIGDIANTDISKYIYSYNNVSKTWENQSLINDNGSAHFFSYTNSFVYSENTNLMYGLKSNGYTQNFIQFDIDTGNVSLLTPHPEQTNYYFGKGFSYQQKIYYTMQSTNELWAYDINNENWEVVATLPYDITQSRNSYITPVVVGNYVYITNGSENVEVNDFWRMNLNNYQWEQLTDNPNSSKNASVYQLNNQLHFVSNEVWIYDLSNQSWEIMPKSKITAASNNFGVDAFIQNNIPYVIYREDFSNISYLNLFIGDLVN